MLHKTLQAKATTTTDRGEFVAIAAAYAVDRVNDRIIPGAFAKTIKAWQESGKQLPLHWDHKGDPEYIIGTVEPASMRETDAGLLVSGKLDLKGSGVARDAWRLIKSDSMALSFGYLPTVQKKNKDGVNDLHEIDLFEITVTPAPVHPDTKFLSFKSAEAALAEETKEEPEEQFKDIQAVQSLLDEKFPGHQIISTSESEKSQDSLKKRSLDLALEVANDFKASERTPTPEPAPEPEPVDAAELRRRSERAVLDTALG